MKTGLTVHASWVKELFYFAVQQGAPIEQLTALTGLQSEHFNLLDARIPVYKLVTLWHAAVELTANPALALQLGASSQSKDTGIISLVCMNSPTLGEMVARIIRYVRLSAESDRLEMVEKNACFELIYRIEIPEYFTPYAIERSFAMALNWIGEFTGMTILPRELHFQYRAPDYLDEYEKVFPAPLFFEMPNNAIVFSHEVLKISTKTYNPYLDELLLQQANQLLHDLPAARTLLQQTQKLIVTQLPTGNLSADIISEKLNMSRRTLARKLKEENTSFQDLLENTRKDLANDYLRQHTLSINDIAFMLGFSESSAFSRAFKRWFGYNPQEHRNSLAR